MIDWQHVDELREALGPEELAEIVAMFIEETVPVIDRLEPRAPTLDRDLHFIKGSAANVGFVELASLCERGESQHRMGDAVDTAGIYACFQSSCAELDRRTGAAA